MAIKLRLLGPVTDAPRSLTYTSSGMPRVRFGVRTGRIGRGSTSSPYGTMARFCDIYLHTGQRIHVEGAYLRRFPSFEGLVRADTIRHVGSRSIPPFPGTVVRFVPARPRITESAGARPIPHEQRDDADASRESAAVDDAIAAAVN